MIPVPLPNGPWEKVALDIKGPLTDGPAKFLIVLIDYYSKWPEIYEVQKITKESVVNALMKCFTTYGLPKVVVSDNGKQIVAKYTENFLKQLGVHHHKVALYAPRQNGLVERFMKVIKDKLNEATMNK